MSGLVTTTAHEPADAPPRSNVQVIFVADTTTLVALISPISLCSFTVAPGWKYNPSRSVMSTGSPVTLELGIMLVIIGAGFFTVKPFARVPDCPPGLVTTTFHEPTGASDGNAKVQII